MIQNSICSCLLIKVPLHAHPTGCNLLPKSTGRENSHPHATCQHCFRLQYLNGSSWQENFDCIKIDCKLFNKVNNKSVSKVKAQFSALYVNTQYRSIFFSNYKWNYLSCWSCSCHTCSFYLLEQVNLCCAMSFPLITTFKQCKKSAFGFSNPTFQSGITTAHSSSKSFLIQWLLSYSFIYFTIDKW